MYWCICKYVCIYCWIARTDLLPGNSHHIYLNISLNHGLFYYNIEAFPNLSFPARCSQRGNHHEPGHARNSQTPLARAAGKFWGPPTSRSAHLARVTMTFYWDTLESSFWKANIERMLPSVAYGGSRLMVKRVEERGWKGKPLSYRLKQNNGAKTLWRGGNMVRSSWL